MTVVFSGTCYLKGLHFGRLEIKKICIAAGITVGATVTHATTLLVSDQKLPLEPSVKWKAAVTRGIPIQSYQQFFEALGVL